MENFGLSTQGLKLGPPIQQAMPGMHLSHWTTKLTCIGILLSLFGFSLNFRSDCKFQTDYTKLKWKFLSSLKMRVSIRLPTISKAVGCQEIIVN